MQMHPHIKCLTHEDCHLDAFYPGKQYRKMKLKFVDGTLTIDKE